MSAAGSILTAYPSLVATGVVLPAGIPPELPSPVMSTCSSPNTSTYGSTASSMLITPPDSPVKHCDSDSPIPGGDKKVPAQATGWYDDCAMIDGGRIDTFEVECGGGVVRGGWTFRLPKMLIVEQSTIHPRFVIAALAQGRFDFPLVCANAGNLFATLLAHDPVDVDQQTPRAVTGATDMAVFFGIDSVVARLAPATRKWAAMSAGADFVQHSRTNNVAGMASAIRAQQIEDQPLDFLHLIGVAEPKYTVIVKEAINSVLEMDGLPELYELKGLVGMEWAMVADLFEECAQYAAAV